MSHDQAELIALQDHWADLEEKRKHRSELEKHYADQIHKLIIEQAEITEQQEDLQRQIDAAQRKWWNLLRSR